MSQSRALTAVAMGVPRVRDVLQAEFECCSHNPVSVLLKTLEDTAKRNGAKTTPRLVAVTKAHDVDKVQWGYQQGLRHFGENYLKELHGKSNILKGNFSGIKWHYLGRVARKKIKVLLDCPGLWMVETLSKRSTAQELNRCWGLRDTTSAPLKVMVQVNTNKAHNKLGCSTVELGDLVQYLLEDCPHLDLCGLMTVGMPGHDPQQGKNPDFAIEMGSTNVRVGTALFGPRAK